MRHWGSSLPGCGLLTGSLVLQVHTQIYHSGGACILVQAKCVRCPRPLQADCHRVNAVGRLLLRSEQSEELLITHKDYSKLVPILAYGVNSSYTRYLGCINIQPYIILEL
jgi:hypothetical protein